MRSYLFVAQTRHFLSSLIVSIKIFPSLQD